MPPALLPPLLLAVAAGAFALANRRAARAIGRDPDMFGRSDGALDFLGRTHRVVFALGFVGLVLPALPGWAAPRALLAGGAETLLAWAGLGLMVAGSGVALWAQHAMGESWRIGIDAAPTALVARGPFRLSGNPTFLGMVLLLAGALAAAPNLLTAGALGAGFVAFSTQIRLEEAHLAALHGAPYRAYAARVRRWLGWRG